MPTRPRPLDVLFEFDAPQTFTDLTATLFPLPPAETHDVWFDEVHEQHSRPSVELAREVGEVVRKLRDKEQQHKHATKKDVSRIQDPDRNKENVGRSNRRRGANSVVHVKRLKPTPNRGLQIKRANHKPPSVQKDVPPASRASVALDRRRKPLVNARSRLNAGNQRTEPSERKEMRDLQELLKRHNKKFKASHTYEPPRHSVRDVKQVQYGTGQRQGSIDDAGDVERWVHLLTIFVLGCVFVSGSARWARVIMPCRQKSGSRRTRRLRCGSSNKMRRDARTRTRVDVFEGIFILPLRGGGGGCASRRNWRLES